MDMLGVALKLTLMLFILMLFILMLMVLGCFAYLALCSFDCWIDRKFDAVFKDWM